MDGPAKSVLVSVQMVIRRRSAAGLGGIFTCRVLVVYEVNVCWRGVGMTERVAGLWKHEKRD
jgi:hypothetical protein